MALYHFTSPKHIHAVLDEGLTKGHVPAQLDPPKLIPGWQWLTTEPSFDQSWNTMTNLDYDRTAYRIKIVLPFVAKSKTYAWTSVADRLVCERAKKSLNAEGDPENWVLFKGVVRPQSFVEVDSKDKYPDVELGVRD